MNRKCLISLLGLLLCTCVSSVTASAQSKVDFPRKSVELQIGGVFPGGELGDNFGPAVVVGGGFGYRVLRNLQLDGGLDVAFGAARASRSIQLAGGGVRKVTNYEVFLPLGARWVLPRSDEQFQFSFGGGYSPLLYTEAALPASQSEQIRCFSCQERTGGGPFAQVGVEFLDQQKRWGYGLAFKAFEGKTEGPTLGTGIPFRTNDRWFNISLTVSRHW